MPELLASAESADVARAAHAEELLALFVREAWIAQPPTQLTAVLRLDAEAPPAPPEAAALAKSVLRLLGEGHEGAFLEGQF